MKTVFTALGLAAALLSSCSGNKNQEQQNENNMNEAITPVEPNYLAEDFADIRVHRYYVNGWDELSLDQKKLLYYLSKASEVGRDILWDQNYRHNLRVRKTLENILVNYPGNKESADWKAFETYAKRVFVSNGIHHHYSMNKFVPEFGFDYFKTLVAQTGGQWPLLEGETVNDLLSLLERVMFDPSVDAKRVNKAKDADLIATSACNFYENLTQGEVEAYYQSMIDPNDQQPVEHGHNSKLVKENGKIVERVWKVGGMYSQAIEQVVYWLRKAADVAETEAQKKSLELLIAFYETGDLKDWDAYNIAWVADTAAVVDVINGFIEVYGDPLGYRATFESVVSIKDFDASRRMQMVSRNAQWFEDNSTIMDEHKKKEVKGVSYKVIEAVNEGGDCSPTTPIGINLPNSNWIRKDYGSKSVSLGNISLAYDKAGGSGMLNEFVHDEEEKARAEQYGELAGKLHTALHEVIGHASGQLNPGIGTPKETLKNYASTLEEGRADLVALYFLMDQKLVDLGLMPSLEVGKAEYDSYIRNGLMVQLRRIEEGQVIEEDHMRNRQMVALWAYEHGKADNVIEKVERDGKTYFNITDYEKLRVLFGELLKEVQRIKSEGDFESGAALVEQYGVQVDGALHSEVLARSASLAIPPYGAFINPKLEASLDESGEILNVEISYPESFLEQMLEYGRENAFLPIAN